MDDLLYKIGNKVLGCRRPGSTGSACINTCLSEPGKPNCHCKIPPYVAKALCGFKIHSMVVNYGIKFRYANCISQYLELKSIRLDKPYI